MAVFRGNAALKWIDSTDTMTQRVLLLREPLRELRASHRQHVYPADSLDMTQRQVYTVGSGAYELVARVRFGDNPQTLIDLIKAGSKLTTLTYVPSLSDPDTNYAVYLISPLSPTALKMDPNTGTLFGDQDVELTFRKTDQSQFQAVQENLFLFSYRAGDSLAAATFTRVTSTANPATYVASSGNVGGDGLLTTAPKSTAGTKGARLTWLSTASTSVPMGARTQPALLIETSRKNLVKDNTNLGTANWTLVNSLTRTSGQKDPAGGTKAWLLNDASSTLVGGLRQQVTVVAGVNAISLFAAPTTNQPSSGWSVSCATTGGTTRAGFSVKWSSGVPTQAGYTPSPSVIYTPPESYGNGFYRFTVLSSTATTAGKLNVDIRPALFAAQKGTLLVYGPVIE